MVTLFLFRILTFLLHLHIDLLSIPVIYISRGVRTKVDGSVDGEIAMRSTLCDQNLPLNTKSSREQLVNFVYLFVVSRCAEVPYVGRFFVKRHHLILYRKTK